VALEKQPFRFSNFSIISPKDRSGGKENIINAIEKEYEFLFNRRTDGPLLRKAHVRFL